MAFAARSSPLDARTLELRLLDDGAPLSMRGLVSRLRESAPFRSFFTATLAHVEWRGFYLELPPMTRDTLDREAELVVVEGDALTRRAADPSAFADRFDERDVVTFPNLGGDAVLVVPAPRGPSEAYAHLGAFLREGPPDQVEALFRVLAETVDERVGAAPIWVSTAGLGVPWLHVRIDARPKYYRHAPYRSG